MDPGEAFLLELARRRAPGLVVGDDEFAIGMVNDKTTAVPSPQQIM